MNHIKLDFGIADQEKKDTLIAMLSALVDIAGFEETEHGLIAFIEESVYQEEEVNHIAQQLQIGFTKGIEAKRNWNEVWEKNFEPVIINGFCSVRAEFHPKPEQVEYDIVITPKMSFGTGHHATTALMMELMRGIDFKGKKVFDFGTGTGILAILAEFLGAAAVFAIDNDEWSVENAIENGQRNGAEKITIQLGTADDLKTGVQFDIILANINRHILLASMNQMASLLKSDGLLLLSGILPEDIPIVSTAAVSSGFIFQKEQTASNWVCMRFAKE